MRCSLFVGLVCIGFACGPGGAGGTGDRGPQGLDEDGDGFSPAQGDCRDDDPLVHPGALDGTCDRVDNDCNGVMDDPFNTDGDFYSTCAGDCDDSRGSVHPGASEELDGLDNDCDGIPDNHHPEYDDDRDGFTEVAGDCNDAEPLVNPGAVEVPEKLDTMGQPMPEGVDNDCDGKVDEVFQPCDTALDRHDLAHYPLAMELCDFVKSVTVTQDADWRARNIVPRFGQGYAPHGGASMLVLSTGLAVDRSSPGWVPPEEGTPFLNGAPHPDPQPDPVDGCGRADPQEVNDYVELALELAVPTNARSLAFDFAFMSVEFPRWVCTDYDDTFLAILESSSFTGNVSFDDAGRPVTINIGFFDVCAPSQGTNCTGNQELEGTGFEEYGGTGWLTTLAPVNPGETIRLRFILFDEGDRIWDSLVLIDNFRWHAEPVDGPITIPLRGPLDLATTRQP